MEEQHAALGVAVVDCSCIVAVVLQRMQDTAAAERRIPASSLQTSRRWIGLRCSVAGSCETWTSWRDTLLARAHLSRQYVAVPEVSQVAAIGVFDRLQMQGILC